MTGLSLALLSREELTHWLQRHAKQEVHFNLARLESAARPGLHVVAVGTSKTQCALAFDANFPDVKSAGQPPLLFHRVTLAGATYDTLRPVFAVLLRNPPDILLLESDLLLYDRPQRQEKDWPLLIRDNIRLIKLLAGFHVKVGANYGEETWPSEAEIRTRKSPAQRLKYAADASQWHITTSGQRLPFLDVLRQLSRQGTRIVLLDLPRAPNANQLVPAFLDPQAHALRDRLLKEEGFAYWSPGTLTDDWYVDQGHLNQTGRLHYSAWLSQRLVNVEPRHP